MPERLQEESRSADLWINFLLYKKLAVLSIKKLGCGRQPALGDLVDVFCCELYVPSFRPPSNNFSTLDVRIVKFVHSSKRDH